MVTHSSTSRPVQCLCMAERTGCPVFTDLWSYVLMCLNCGFLFYSNSCTENAIVKAAKGFPKPMQSDRTASALLRTPRAVDL
jgi:hypothetical protein